jgi:hypothetical protein
LRDVQIEAPMVVSSHDKDSYVCQALGFVLPSLHQFLRLPIVGDGTPTDGGLLGRDRSMHRAPPDWKVCLRDAHVANNLATSMPASACFNTATIPW